MPVPIGQTVTISHLRLEGGLSGTASESFHEACDNFPRQGKTELPVHTGNMDSGRLATQPSLGLNPDPSRDKPQVWQGLSFWVQHRLQSIL